MRFIIFIDDLSFEKIDSDYKIIKSTLDGSIQNQPTNIVLYVTSNRRHLMPRDMIDNERSSAIHTDESVEEKISLSDRFGLWIGFHNLSQVDYLKIVKSYCNYYEIKCDKIVEDNALKWSLQRGNRTGRTAWQYIIQLAAEKNLKLNF
jgi:predicted AAA+ superfamily ATPase